MATEIIFITLLAFVAYAYVGYPTLLLVLSCLFGRPVLSTSHQDCRSSDAIAKGI